MVSGARFFAQNDSLGTCKQVSHTHYEQPTTDALWSWEQAWISFLLTILQLLQPIGSLELKYWDFKEVSKCRPPFSAALSQRWSGTCQALYKTISWSLADSLSHQGVLSLVSLWCEFVPVLYSTHLIITTSTSTKTNGFNKVVIWLRSDCRAVE